MSIPSEQSGFTLIEMLAVTIVIGVVAAIASPRLIGSWRRHQVNVALRELNGAVKETQRQAIRQGRICRININTANNQLTGNPTSCLLSDRKIDNNINIRTNLSGTPPNISFSYRGSTTKSGTIVVSADSINNQRCFVISLGIGITRTGNYTGTSTGSVSASNCESN